MTSLVIMLSTVLLVASSVVLSDELFADIRSKELVADVSVLTELVKSYKSGELDRAVYEKIVDNASKSNAGVYVITDTKGNIEYEEASILTTHEKKEVVEFSKKLARGVHSSYQLYRRDEKYFLLTGSTIVVNDEIVATAIVYADMIDLEIRKKEFYQSMMISFGVVIPCAIILSYIILKRIIRPIRNVASVARAISKGDFAVKADETQKGEIGILSKSINRISTDIYENISQLYIEKSRLEQVLNSLKDGMISIDEKNIITHFNSIVLEMFDLDEGILGKSLNEILILNEALWEINKQLDGKDSISIRSLHNDLILNIVIAPIVNEKGEPAGAVVVFSDITEIERLEMMRRDYVANVSHELRSPLTSIRGLIEPLMDKIVTKEEDVARYHNIIYQESLRLTRLVDDIMELSRLQTSESNIEKSNFDLNLITEMVYERYRLYDESIELVYNQVELPMVNTNYDRIEQILVILLDNAFKFTVSGGRIELITQVRKKDVLVTVKDNGLGISEEDLPFVFNRFYKTDTSRTYKGTGLGLSIAKEIMTIMDEKISVKSVEGKGSVFEFTVEIDDEKEI